MHSYQKQNSQIKYKSEALNWPMFADWQLKAASHS